MLLTIFLALPQQIELNKQDSFYAITLAEKCKLWHHPVTTCDCRELMKADNLPQDSKGKRR